MWGGVSYEERTDFSACCWKCTKMMVDTAKSDVPARAIFEPREAIVAEEVDLVEGEREVDCEGL